MKILISNMKKELQDRQDQNFFLCNDGLSSKKGMSDVVKIRYSDAKIRARNIWRTMLILGSTKMIIKADHLLSMFYTTFTQNMNPFSLDRKFPTVKEQQMVYML